MVEELGHSHCQVQPDSSLSGGNFELNLEIPDLNQSSAANSGNRISNLTSPGPKETKDAATSISPRRPENGNQSESRSQYC